MPGGERWGCQGRDAGVEAAFWGLVGGFALLVGGVAGLKLRASQRIIGLIMAFGAGVLISALAFELTEEAFRRGGLDAVAAGMAGGAISFFAGDWIIDHRGGNHRKRSGGEQQGGSATAIVLGALMDGIPESVAIGVSLVGGGGGARHRPRLRPRVFPLRPRVRRGVIRSARPRRRRCGGRPRRATCRCVR